jgi:hypothetical protein
MENMPPQDPAVPPPDDNAPLPEPRLSRRAAWIAMGSVALALGLLWAASDLSDPHVDEQLDADAASDADQGATADRRPGSADATAAVVEAAARWGVTVPVEWWGDEGPALDADAHAARLDDLLATGTAAGLATDASWLGRMVEVAGPVVAWTDDPAAAGPGEGEGTA